MIWFFRLSVLAYFVSVALAWRLYPDEVPVHFDAEGVADRFQPSHVAVLSMAAVGVGMTALLGLVIRVCTRGGLRHVNVPHRSWWLRPENTERLRSMLAADLAWIAGCTMTLLTAMLLISIRVADDPRPSLGGFGVAALLGFLVAVGGQVILMYTTRYRPRDPR